MNHSEENKASDLSGKDPNEVFPGYPEYPPSEDIYRQGHKEADINPEDPTRNKIPVEADTSETFNEKDFDDDVSGSDLDIPGAELDDDLEDIGSEDEENNHYSIGGDNHTDLEEDNG